MIAIYIFTLKFQYYTGLNTTKKTININVIVGISLIILKNLADFIFVLFLNEIKHLPRYSLKIVKNITKANLICNQTCEKVEVPS